MRRRFEPAGALRGRVAPPPDKSISHRAALLGAMCDEPVTVENYLYAEDTLSTLDALRSLGAGLEPEEDGVSRGNPSAPPHCPAPFLALHETTGHEAKCVAALTTTSFDRRATHASHQRFRRDESAPT